MIFHFLPDVEPLLLKLSHKNLILISLCRYMIDYVILRWAFLMNDEPILFVRSTIFWNASYDYDNSFPFYIVNFILASTLHPPFLLPKSNLSLFQKLLILSNHQTQINFIITSDLELKVNWRKEIGLCSAFL